MRGHTDVMTLLLAAGATDIEKAWDRANALYAASYAGKLDAMSGTFVMVLAPFPTRSYRGPGHQRHATPHVQRTIIYYLVSMRGV